MRARHPHSAQIHVLVANLPRLLADVVTSSIGSQTDMTAVTAARDAARFEDEDIDVVVSGPLGPNPASAIPWRLFDHGHVPLVVLSRDGRQLEVYERTIVQEAAYDELLTVIRTVVSPR